MDATGTRPRGRGAAGRQAPYPPGSWTRVADRLVGDARATLGLVGLVAPGLDRSFGRFTRGYRAALAPVTGALRTADSGLAALGNARRTVTDGITRITDLAARL